MAQKGKNNLLFLRQFFIIVGFLTLVREFFIAEVVAWQALITA